MNRPPILIYVLVLALGALISLSVLWLSHAPGAPSPIRLWHRAPAPAPPKPRPEGLVFSTANLEPETTPDLLPAGAGPVYAFYNLPELARSSMLDATWSRDGKLLGKVPPSDIQPGPQSPGRGSMTLRPPGGKLVPGIYEVEIRTERRRFRASFVVAAGAEKIVGQQAPVEAELTVSGQVTARGVGAHGEPVQAGTSFGRTDRIYFVFQYKGAEPGTGVTVQWWGGTTEIKNARREVTLSSAEGWAHAWMQADSGLPPGTYTVTATVTGQAKELARAQFTVQ